MGTALHRLRRFRNSRDGAAAVEFALVVPLFLLLVFGIVVYGAYLAVVHGVQQLAAEAARSSVAGLSDQERSALATSYVAANAQSYPLIAQDRLIVSAGQAPDNANVYVVTVRYDASNMFIYALPNLVPAPPPNIVRAAAIQRGGY
jgi:Flp pilus assembly protein TadG